MFNNPSLPQHDLQKELRKKELLQAQEIYTYTYDYEALPGVAMLDGVPKKEEPRLTWFFKAASTLIKILKNRISFVIDSNTLLFPIKLLLVFIKLPFSKRKEKLLENISYQFIKKPFYPQQTDLNQYDAYFQSLKIPESKNSFQTDTTFANMRVSGLNPVVVHCLKEFDTNFGITNDIFTSIHGFEEDTLEKALQEKRLFICDYVALKEIKNSTFASKQKYAYAPKALFAIIHSNKPQNLKPIAIQCVQDSGDNVPLFTPNDGYSWEIAKTIVQIADFNHHELITHLGGTHLVLEPFVVSTHRQLSLKHPLSVLLLPHMEGTAFINFQAQKRLVNNDGPFEKLFFGTMPSNRAVVGKRLSLSFNDSLLINNLKLRGVDDLKLIYPYRDDSLQVWTAIEEWVSSYIDIYYTNDSDLLQDSELQAWSYELVRYGHVNGLGDTSEGVIGTLLYLKQILTMLIFTSSAQHSAVNFTQEAYPGYTPCMPASGYAPVPTDKNHTREDWFNLIAPLSVADDQTDLMYTLSGIHYTVLGDYGRWYFKDKNIKKPLKVFQKQLKEIEKKILQRNLENKENAYKYMLPSSIPQSINI